MLQRYTLVAQDEAGHDVASVRVFGPMERAEFDLYVGAYAPSGRCRVLDEAGRTACIYIGGIVFPIKTPFLCSTCQVMPRGRQPSPTGEHKWMVLYRMLLTNRITTDTIMRTFGIRRRAVYSLLSDLRQRGVRVESEVEDGKHHYHISR